MPEPPGDLPRELCPRCGCDLSGLRLREGAVCPECSQPIDPPTLRAHEWTDFLVSRQNTWLFLVGTPLLMFGALLVAEGAGRRAAPAAFAVAWIGSSLLCALSLRRHEAFRAQRRTRLSVALNAMLFALLYGAAIVSVVTCALGGFALLRLLGR